MAKRPITEVVAEAATDEMVEAIASFYDDPLGFVYFVFPWGEEGTDLHDEEGPDDWQAKFLTDLGAACRERLVSGANLGAYLAGATTGHGVGKSAVVAWVILWFMSTRINPSIVVTANTQGQLRGKTWRELALWHRRAINGSWFHWTATRLYKKGAESTHFADAVPWSKENTEAIAGTHSKDVLIVFDESSGIDDKVWEVTEGALTTARVFWLAFGNMTRSSGRFFETMGKFRHRWNMQQVDTREAKMAKKGQIQKWIDDYGEDSDFVRVRVRGLPPRAESSQLIGTDLVEQAMLGFRRRFGDQVKRGLMNGGAEWLTGYRLDDNPLAPVIMTLDVSRFGGDQSVLGYRQGKTFISLEKWRELDAVQLCSRVAPWITVLRPDLMCVDGGGVGGGHCDILRAMGFEIEEVDGGLRALDPRKFFNRRAEMWWNMKEWLKAGGLLDYSDLEISRDLTGPEYGYSGRTQLIQLESKEDMRAEGKPSPDTGDACAMSFYLPVAFRNAATTVAAQLAMAAAEQRYGGGGGSGRSWMSF